MSRPLRVEFEGAVYHVMGRGQGREAIVRDEEDRRKWMQTLHEACSRFQWEVLAYALMSNHYHLALRTPRANLSRGLQWLLGTYATRFRVRHGTTGSIFAGRFKALLIEEEARRLRTVIEYIHLNAWRAGLARLPAGFESWPWSSLFYFTRPLSQRPKWLMVSEGLRREDLRDDARGRRRYLEQIEERARLGTRRSDKTTEENLSLVAALKRGWYFGSEAFRDQLQARLKTAMEGQRDVQAIEGSVRRDYGESEARRLLAKALAHWDWDAQRLRQLPKGDAQKALLACWLREKSGVSLGWLSEKLNMGVPAATCRLITAAARARATRPAAGWLRELEAISK